MWACARAADVIWWDALVKLVNRSMVGTVTAFKILSERWPFRHRAEIRDMSAWCTLGLTQGQLGACVLPVFNFHGSTCPSSYCSS
jgi:hypothetical protein